MSTNNEKDIRAEDTVYDPKTMNAERAQDAGAAMAAFIEVKEPQSRNPDGFYGQSNEEYLVDLLSDLRHWARSKGLDFNDLCHVSERHFEDEVGEELRDEGGAK